MTRATAASAPSASTLSLPRDALCRVLAALIGEESGRAQTGPAWSEATPIDEDGAGVDSVSRLGVAARVSEFFDLAPFGLDDPLLLAPRLGDWIDIVEHRLASGPAVITVRTSGTTGTPRACPHRAEHLIAEVSAPGALQGSGRIFSTVPPHHIYGFLFTVLAPALLDRPVLSAQTRMPGSLLAETRAGDVIVATPHFWHGLLGHGRASVQALHGVSAGSPLDDELLAQARAAGIDLQDTYGASETGGIGRRSAPGAFALMPHLAWAEDGVTLRRRHDRSTVDPPDCLERVGHGFRLGTRLDGALSVAGVTVDPAKVGRILLDEDGVAACAVRLDRSRRPARLAATVVPHCGAEEAALKARLEQRCTALLRAPERPITFDFAETLPLSPMGKPLGWQGRSDGAFT